MATHSDVKKPPAGRSPGEPVDPAQAGPDHDHDPGLAHHFDSLSQQTDATSLGMWIFLVTEILFFGGLFTVYMVYRWMAPAAFAQGSHHLNVVLGATNTVVLLLSSLTMAMAVRAAQIESRRALQWLLVATLVLGFVFLGIKAVEYMDKFRDHLVPGPNFYFEGAVSPRIQLFFSLYFAMTGLHAAHMVIGAGLVGTVLLQAGRKPITERYKARVDTVGLYWHFVDIVWIFLFPLLYLLGRHYH